MESVDSITLNHGSRSSQGNSIQVTLMSGCMTTGSHGETNPVTGMVSVISVRSGHLKTLALFLSLVVFGAVGVSRTTGTTLEHAIVG